MYYIEYVEKKPGVAQAQFHEAVRAATDRWDNEHPEDELVLFIGRTWRLGPRPTYMVVWKIKDISTLDSWSREFTQSTTQANHSQFSDVATIVDAGLYEDLGSEVL